MCRIAVRRDERHVYPIEMWSAHELFDAHPHWRRLDEIVASVRAVPPPSQVDAAAGISSHWLD